MKKILILVISFLFLRNCIYSQVDSNSIDSVSCDNMFDMEQRVGYILGYVEILSTKKDTLNSMYFCFIKDVPNEIKKLSKFKKINNYNSTLYYFRSEKLQKLLKEKIENETIYDVLCYQAINNLRNSNVMSFSFSRNIYTNKCWDDKFDEKIAFETDSILSNLVGFFLLFHLDYIEKTGGYFIYQKVNIDFLKVKNPDIEDLMYKSYIISKYKVDGKKTYKINREKEIYVVPKKVKNDSIVIIPYKVDILKN